MIKEKPPQKLVNMPHYIPDWAEHRGFKTQANLVKALGADKGIVSRWYSGSVPNAHWQERLAELFNCDPESLFRHPDEDWIRRFFKGRQREEIERMKQSLELHFPKKTG